MKSFDWHNPQNLRHRAWESVKEFFGKEEPEHPLSPEMVALESENSDDSTEKLFSDSSDGSGNFYNSDANGTNAPQIDRVHRRTEQRSLNERPTIWPG